MPERQCPTLQSFSAGTMQFLEELAINNQRPWFESNRHRYESDLLDPALSFIEHMGPGLERISSRFVAIPKRTGGSLMRIYRDARFARDKTPYKTNIGIQFRHERGRDVHAPGFYVHIEPGRCFLGAGIWHPASQPLAAIRSHIVEQGKTWQRASNNKLFREYFEFGGSRLQRPPRGFAPDATHLEDLKRKDFIACCPINDKQVLAKDFSVLVAQRFRATKPLMAFLCAALNLQF